MLFRSPWTVSTAKIVQTTTMSEILNKQITVGTYRVVPTELIGEGGFAYVFKAISADPLRRSEIYALKRVLATEGTSILSQMREEVAVMHALPTHPNLLNIVAYQENAIPERRMVEVLILLDYIPGGNVGELIVEAINMKARKQSFMERSEERRVGKEC